MTRHGLVVFGRIGLDHDGTPGRELIEQPLALRGPASRARDDDLLVHGGGGRAEKRVQADHRSGVGIEHGGHGGRFHAGDVSQNAVRRQVGRQPLDDLGSRCDWHAQQRQLDARAQRLDRIPVFPIQYPDPVSGIR